MAIKKVCLIIFLFIISSVSVLGEFILLNSTDTKLDSPYIQLQDASTGYCSLDGCTIDGSVTINGNLTLIGDILNVTVTVVNYNVTGAFTVDGNLSTNGVFNASSVIATYINGSFNWTTNDTWTQFIDNKLQFNESKLNSSITANSFWELLNGDLSPKATVTSINISDINVTINDTLIINKFTTPTGMPWSAENHSGNLHFHFDEVGGNNYVSFESTGTFFLFYGNPGPANDYEMFSFAETQGADTYLNFYEGGTNHNRFWNSGSGRVGGPVGYLCSELVGSDVVDCDTPTTGADWVVQDTLYSGNRLITSNISTNGTTRLSGDLYVNGTSTFRNNITINTTKNMIVDGLWACTFKNKTAPFNIFNITLTRNETDCDGV